jgi:hypothetical protein
MLETSAEQALVVGDKEEIHLENHQYYNAHVKTLPKASRINNATLVIPYMNNGMITGEACNAVGCHVAC